MDELPNTPGLESHSRDDSTVHAVEAQEQSEVFVMKPCYGPIYSEYCNFCYSIFLSVDKKKQDKYKNSDQ